MCVLSFSGCISSSQVIRRRYVAFWCVSPLTWVQQAPSTGNNARFSDVITLDNECVVLFGHFRREITVLQSLVRNLNTMSSNYYKAFHAALSQRAMKVVPLAQSWACWPGSRVGLALGFVALSTENQANTRLKGASEIWS